MRWVSLLALLLLLFSAGVARAEPGLLVGVTEDGLKFEADSALRDARELGIGAFRITLRWRPGLAEPTAAQTAELDGATRGVSDTEIILSTFGERAVHAPTTADRRDEYCGFLGEIVSRYEQISYVTIWNEPNKTFFWSPQFNPDGTSAAPGAYVELLARCWDVLHDIRPDIGVIAPSTAPRGNDNPNAVSNVSHSPIAFVRELGRAYRESGRDAPIFDIVGHHIHAIHSAERPWRQHRGSGVAQGDVDRLTRAYSDAFEGTAQPVPGRCVDGSCAPIWWLEAGFQTEPDRAKRSLYSGFEISPRSLPDSVGEVSLDPIPDSRSLAPDQATQIVSALRLAYCQPHVEAFFNFLLWDEPRLEGWQSAPHWSDRTPKDSHAAFRSAISEVADGEIDCDDWSRAVEQARLEALPKRRAAAAAPVDPAPASTEDEGIAADELAPWVAAGVAGLLALAGLTWIRRRRRRRFVR